VSSIRAPCSTPSPLATAPFADEARLVGIEIVTVSAPSPEKVFSNRTWP
jgi:hypothetical protein